MAVSTADPGTCDPGGGLGEGSIVDHFRVVRRIGHGGMGEVYLARDTQLGRKVALKLIRRAALVSREARERFLFEAQATAAFSHPNIVGIYHVGNHAGTPYVALEYVEGETLRERIRREPPSSVSSLRWLHAIASALAEAHQQKIIHLDLKPDNIMVGKDGRLRVLDFGLARFTYAAPVPDHAPLPLAATAAETAELLRGTPAYLAPEQWRGSRPTPASDVWAFGVIAFELLAGRRPYDEGDGARFAEAVMSAEPAPGLAAAGPALPAEIALLVDRCLSKPEGLRPSMADALVVLERALASGRPPLDASPFRGLLPFSESHAGLFFGRDAEVAALLERLRDTPVLPVVGFSGAGKTSFVQAGVIPRLRESEPWQVVALRPGSDPFRNLAHRLLAGGTVTAPQAGEGNEAERELAGRLRESPGRLALELLALARRDGQKVLLFVDQLEEVVTLVDDEGEQAAFLHAVCAAADDPQGPVRVIFTVRDDFLGRLHVTPEASEALGRVTILRAPGRAALAEIMRRPLAAVGYAFEDEPLVEEMIASIANEPAMLPLVQFALGMLWESRDRERRLLTRGAYQAIGGVGGALASHADEVLAGLSEADLAVARVMLLRLVTPEGTRRVMARGRALDGLGAAAEAVLARLTGSRLISARRSQGDGEPELELAHESLIRSWRRLARWIEESKDELVFLADLGQAADLWHRRGRRPEEVWSGQALADARGRLARLTGRPPALVAEFIAAGEAQASRAARRRRRWLAAGGVALAAVLVGSLVFSVALADRERRAVRERANAEQRRAEAQRESAAAAFARGDNLEARAKLRQAMETRDDVESRALWWQLREQPLVWKADLGLILQNVAVAPNGRFAAVGSLDGNVQIIDLATRERRVLRIDAGEQTRGVAISPDSAWVAAGSASRRTTAIGTIRLWNVATGEARNLGTDLPGVVSVEFSADGHRLVATGGGIPFPYLQVFDLDSGKPVATLRGHEGVVLEAHFTPDGERVVSCGGNDGTVRVWDVASEREIARVKAHPTAYTGVHTVAVSPDGQHAASGSMGDHEINVWRLPGLELERSLAGHRDNVARVRFSPDGKRLASSGWDRTVRVWDLDSGEPLRELSGAAENVFGLAFLPDGKHVVATDFGGQVRLWDVALESERRGRAPCQARAVANAPLTGRTAFGCSDGSVRFIDPVSGEEVASIAAAHENDVTALAFSPDGRLLATGGLDRKIVIWDVERREAVAVLVGHANELSALAFSPDGKLLASVTKYGGQLRIWEMATRGLRHDIEHGSILTDVAFSPDGRSLVTTAWDRTAKLWDVERGQAVRVLPHDAYAVAGAFHPDGHLVTLTSRGDLFAWPLPVGEASLVARLPGGASALAVSRDGRTLAVAGDGGCTLVDWDTRRTRPIPGCGGALAFAGDATVLFGAVDGARAAWDTTTGRLLWRTKVAMAEPMRVLTHRGWLPASPPGDPAWARAARAAERGAGSEDGRTLCLSSGSLIEAWDVPADRKLFEAPAPAVDRLFAGASSCLALSGHELVRWSGGERAVVASEVAGATVSRGDLVVWNEQRAWHVDPATGAERGGFAIDRRVSAMLAGDDATVVGFADGFIAVGQPSGGAFRGSLTLADTPSSEVRALALGPAGTVVAGFADGVVGVWSLETGGKLREARLVGPVEDLLVGGDLVLAASALGDAARIDLSVLGRDYCSLMREIWAVTPVAWSDTGALSRPPPRNHPCAAPRD